MQSSMKIGEAIYKAQQEKAAAGKTQNETKSSQESKPEEGVVDADFEEVKKD